jgi:hypothetical protein
MAMNSLIPLKMKAKQYSVRYLFHALKIMFRKLKNGTTFRRD